MIVFSHPFLTNHLDVVNTIETKNSNYVQGMYIKHYTLYSYVRNV